MVLVRQEIGEVLRDVRLQKGRTLRQVASRASVALGYLSEVERGQKEASSEILASVAEALDTPISMIMREVGDRLAVIEGITWRRDSTVPDTLPDDLVAEFDAELVSASAGVAFGIALAFARPRMKLSEFRRAVTDEFGDVYGRAAARPRLSPLGERTGQEALDAGGAPRGLACAVRGHGCAP